MHLYSLQQMLMIIIGLLIFICFLVFRTFDKTLALLNIFWPKSKLSWVLWWRGGNRKESLQLCFWNLNICIEKVDAKCCLAKMTLLMMSLPLACVFQCLFKFALIGGNLTTQSTGSHRGFGGGVSNSRDVFACSPSFSCPAGKVPWRACSQVRLIQVQLYWHASC